MITTRLLRHISATRCLRLLQGGRTLSRADMARALGQTRATVGHAVAELASAGLVLETAEPATTRIGRPGVGLRLNPQGARFLGVEMDTRALSGVVLNLDMTVAHRRVQPMADHANPEAVQRQIVALAQDLATRCDPARLHGLGVAVPCLVGRGGQVVNAPLMGWRDVPLQPALTAALPSTWTVEVANDAFAFARADLSCATDPPANLLMVLLAEGIGAAQVAGSRLIPGAHGFAGELGHMIVSMHGCTGPLESFAGAAGFKAVMGQGLSLAEGVAHLCTHRDQPQIARALDLWAEALAMGLANAALLLDPDQIVLGGPLSDLFPLIAPQLEAHLARLMLPGHGRPTLRLSHLAQDGTTSLAAAIGAAALLRERLFTLPDLQDRL